VADADEATRQYMQQEATQEFVYVQRQESLLVLVSGVSPAECDFVIQEGNEPAIGDPNAMSVSAEIAKHLVSPAERRFTIDNPADGVKLADQTSEQSGIDQAAKQAMELELSGSVSLLERFKKLSAENFAEDFLGEKETATSRANPASVIAGQAAGGHDAVNVRMML
jgi:hypothetical protein